MTEKEEKEVVEEVTDAKTTEKAPQEQTKTPGLYTAGLVCGIVGLCLFWSVWIGLICGVLGIVFGAVTLSKTNKKIPIILGGVATGLAIIMLVVYSVIGGRLFNRAADKLENSFNDAFDNIENATEKVEDAENIIDDIEDIAEDRQEQHNQEDEQSKKNIEEATKRVEEKMNEASDKIDDAMNSTSEKLNELFNN